MTVPQETAYLADLQARVDALKTPHTPVKTPVKNKGGRPRGSKNKPKQLTPERDGSSRESWSDGDQPVSYIIPRNVQVPEKSLGRFGGGTQRHQRNDEGDAATVERFIASADGAIGISREAESATRGRDAGADQSDDGATRPAAGFGGQITDRVKRAAQQRLNSGFERLANLGKDREEEDIPRIPRRARLAELPGVEAARGFVEDMQEEYARVFDEDEADARRNDVVEMIIGYGNDLNDFLSMSNAAQARCDIWELDREEAEPQANIWLKRAKRDKRAAAVLRLAMEGDDYKRSIIVLGPRLWRTAGWYPNNGGFRMTPWQLRGNNDEDNDEEGGPS